MKYTLISKSGKVGDLQVTLEEALPALQAKYGDNGRAIIRELLDLIAQDVIPSKTMPGMPNHYRCVANPLSMQELFALCRPVYDEIFITTGALGWDEDGFVGEVKRDDRGEMLPLDQQAPAFVAPALFCPYCGIEGDDNTLCQSTGCCRDCLDIGP